MIHNELFSYMSRTLQKDITFPAKVQMVLAKINLYLNLPVYSLISTKNINNENIITNNYSVSHTHISTRKWWWTTFQVAVAYVYSRTLFNKLYIEIKHKCWKNVLQTKYMLQKNSLNLQNQSCENSKLEVNICHSFIY